MCQARRMHVDNNTSLNCQLAKVNPEVNLESCTTVCVAVIDRHYDI